VSRISKIVKERQLTVRNCRISFEAYMTTKKYMYVLSRDLIMRTSV
jgi:hypothetical protein